MTLQEAVAAFGLPDLPEEYEGDDERGGTVELVLYREQQEKIVLIRVSKEDARAYCSREDTRSGDLLAGWFVGWQR